MQRIVGVLLILFGLGWLASQIPAAPNTNRPQANSWRRTCDGWERAEWLHGTALRQQPALHPALVGLVQLLFALAALLGLSPHAEQKDQTRYTPFSAVPPKPPSQADPCKQE